MTPAPAWRGAESRRYAQGERSPHFNSLASEARAKSSSTRHLLGRVPEGFRDPWLGSTAPRINPHWSNPMKSPPGN